MFEALVASVINRIIGEYVDNLETSQLSIGIWQGDVTLNNLRLKKEALDKFNLPINITEGYLGHLTLSIPWSDLKNKPVRVFIKNVYLLTAPLNEDDYEAELEEERSHKLKMDKIETAEMLMAGNNSASSPTKAPEDKIQNNDSFMTQLITKIVDNLQIKIENIHIRYEDKMDKRQKNPFAAGITLSELSAVSTNENWVEAFLHEEVGVIHKRVRLNCLAMYWNTDSETMSGMPLEISIKKFTELIASDSHIPSDHQYILKPVTGEGKIKLNKTIKNNEARTNAILSFDEFGFVLDDAQYTSILNIFASFSSLMRSRQFRKYRPPRSITPSIDPLAWFKYAGTCVLSTIHEKNKKWTWEYMANRRDDRIMYIKLYKAYKSGSVIPEEDVELRSILERKLSYEDIRFYRSLAISQMKKERAVLTINKAAEPQTTLGWISGWWGSSSPTASTAEVLPETFTDLHMKQIMETIEYDPKSYLETDLPPESILLNLKWELQKGSLSLKNRNQNLDLLAVVFQNFHANIIQHPVCIEGNLSLQGMTVSDGSTPGTLYPTLIEAVQSKGFSNTGNDSPLPFFHLDFEHKPLDGRADGAISLKMLPLQVVMNPAAVNGVIGFFTPKVSTISAFQSAAQDTIQGFTSKTRASLEYAIGTHKTFDVKIDIAAPIFIMPESCIDANSVVVVIDAGHLRVESNLIDIESKKEIEAKQGLELSPDDVKKLESLLYDRFTCTLTSVQILVGHSVENCLARVNNDSKNEDDLHFLERVDVSFNIASSILPKLANHTRMCVTGKLPRLHINLSDKKYKNFMKILGLLTARPPTKVTSPQVASPRLWNSESTANSPLLPIDGDIDSFFDAEESLEANMMIDKPPAEPPNKVLLDFIFEVGQVSVSLRKTLHRDAEKTLAELKISNFNIHYIQRPYDYKVQIGIRSVSVEDQMSTYTELSKQSLNLQYLLIPTERIESSTEENLVVINYSNVKPLSPEYQGIDQTVEVSFASVDILLVQNSILSLYDFLLSTFTSKNTNPPPNSVRETSNQTIQPTSINQVSSTMVIRTSMKSINFIIVQNQERLATASFGAGKLDITFKNGSMLINGSLGNLSVVDDVLRVGKSRLFKQFLKIDGLDVADFSLETFILGHTYYPGYDTALKLRASSVRLTYIEPLLRDLQSFFSEFQKMHVLLNSARRAVNESQETAGKFHFDLDIETPIIEFPDFSLVRSRVMTMYLGKIRMKNKFVNITSNLCASEVTADIISMKLISNLSSHDEIPLELQLIEDVNINLKMTSIIKYTSDLYPPSRITALSNDVKLNITSIQYQFILDVLGSVTSLLFGAKPSSSNTIPDIPEADENDFELNGGFYKGNANTGNSNSNTVAKMMSDICVKIPSITLTICEEKIDDILIHPISLSRLQIDRFILKLSSWECGDRDIELTCQELNIYDMRADNQSAFKNIVGPTESRPHEHVAIRYNRTGLGKMDVLITFDSLRLIFALDLLLLVKNFFTKPFQAQPNEDPVSESDSENSSDNDNNFTYRINFVDFEIVLLHNNQTDDSEAILLIAKDASLSYNLITSFGVRDFGMFFCVMNSRTDTMLRFIQNFDLTVTMDSRLTAPGHQLTNISVDISPLMMRTSYYDIRLIRDIFNGMINHDSNSDQSVVSSQAAEIPTPIIMSREKLQVTTQGIRVILIDDLHDMQLPMFDFVIDKLVLGISDWSSSMLIDTGLKLHVNNFNTKNSHWEPLIEKFEFYLNISKQNECLMTDIYASRKLEINLTHVFVETFLNTMHLLSTQPQRNRIARSSGNAPYILRNETGYDMHLWIESTGDGLDTEIQKLENRSEIPWRFDDWRVMRESILPSPNKLSIQIHGPAWESLKNISVDREGVRTYVLRPNISQVRHRLVCDVRMKNNIKYVTFRSTSVLQNLTSIGVEIQIVNSQGKPTSEIFKLGPGEEFSLPIESSFYDKVIVRPENFGYNWSNEKLFWKDLQRQDNLKLPSLISCSSSDATTAPFRFQVNTSGYPIQKNIGATYPFIRIKLLPPFQLENLLPYDFRYIIFDKSSRQEHRGNLQKGYIDPVHTVDPTHSLYISIEIPGTDFRPSEVAILNNAELDYRDEQITLIDSDQQELHLRIKYNDKLEFGGRKVIIYSPYILLNRTDLDIMYSARSLLATPKLAAGQAKKKQTSDMAKPFMFSYTNFEPLRNRALIKIADSDWSKPLSFDAVGSSFDVSIPSYSPGENYHFGINVREGDGKYFLTKVVTIAPRFIIKSNMTEDLYCKQVASNAPILLKPGQVIPLNIVPDFEPGQLYLRLSGLIDEWSSAFNINQIGRIFVKLGKMGSTEEDLIRVESIIEDSTIFTIFSREEGRWPFRIDNKSDANIVFWQLNTRNNKYQIPAGQSRQYAWDSPSMPGKALVIHVNGREREIDVREIGQLPSLKYPTPGNSNSISIMGIQVFAEGPTLVISLSSDLDLSASNGHISSPDRSTISQLSSPDKSTPSVKSKEEAPDKELFSVQIRLAGIGISVINQDVKELLYATAKNVAFSYSDSQLNEAMTFGINWLQIDNQLGVSDQIFLYPSVIPKEGEEDFHPVLMMSLSKSKDQSYGLDYYNWFTILLQELSIDMDEDFLYALINFCKFETAGSEKKNIEMFDQDLSMPSPRPVETDARMYFEKFLMQPAQFNISFQRTQTVNIEDTRENSRGNILTFLFDVLTMTIGNIHDAPIRLNALEIRHPIVTFSQLIDLMMKFYSQEAVGQLHKVIGSADFLGNPVGLFNNVGSGFRDFFYEPIQGFEITRPQDFGIGLAKGSASLFKKTVYGVTDTLSKFTGSVSKGLSVITLDEDFQANRIRSVARNRPKHAVTGVTVGASSLVTSIASGVTGVLTKPVEGFEKGGVGGFFQGIGKGLVGVVSKPLIGVFDLATNVTEGIRNTTTYFEKELEKIRLPRFVSKDKILTPYDAREAAGYKLLRTLDSGKYAMDDYFSHLELRIDDLVAIVTNARVIMAKAKINRTDWDVPYEELQLVRIDNGGITLIRQSRQGARARIIPCPDAPSAQWLMNRIETMYGASGRSEEY